MGAVMSNHTTPSANLRKTLLTIAIADNDGEAYHVDTIAAQLVDLPLPYLGAIWRGAEMAYSAKLNGKGGAS